VVIGLPLSGDRGGMARVAVALIDRLGHSGLSRFGLIDEYSGIHKSEVCQDLD
jgi:hypothetical protein